MCFQRALKSWYAAEKRLSDRMAVSISQKNDLKKDVDQTRRFLANRRRSTYELLIPNEDGNGYCPQNHANQRISEKMLNISFYSSETR